MNAHAAHPHQSADHEPGFSEYLGILRRRGRLLAGIALPIAALGALLAIGLPNVYRSSGLIEIEEATNLQNVLAREQAKAPYADQYVQSLSTVVLSDKNLKRLLAEHQLYEGQDPDDAAIYPQLRRDIDVKIVTVPILDPNTGREREVVSAFTVAYDNRDPHRAQAGAAWLVNSFLEENRRDRQGQAASTAKFFAAEAERMRARVGELENKLAEFKEKHAGRLPDFTQVNLSVMERTETDIQNIETQMQALRRERVFLMAQLQQARSAAPETASLRQLEEEYRRKSTQYDESHPDMISLRRQMDQLRSGGSTAGMTLQQQLQMQRSILSEARQRYSEDHPDIKRINRTIQSLEARIASGENAQRTLSSDSPMAMQLQTQLNATDSQLAALQARSMELRTKLNDLEGRLSAAPEVEREYQSVTRDLASARAKYEELLKRQMDAEVSEAAIAGGTADKFRVASMPGTPREPAKPQRIAIFVVSLVLGIAFGLTAVILAQLFDQTVRGARDVREVLDVTPLAAIPVIETAGTLHLRKRQLLMFGAKTVVVIAIVYYATARFLF
jgi:succinoglycan biosynthesis transport protein ExoP